jgi:uncharacterized protein
MSLYFEWDDEKAVKNLEKHGISFEEASTAFGDPRSLTIDDPDHSTDEQRYVLLGRALTGRLLVVVHVERDEERIRLITARRANRREQRVYERYPP